MFGPKAEESDDEEDTDKGERLRHLEVGGGSRGRLLPSRVGTSWLWAHEGPPPRKPPLSLSSLKLTGAAYVP